MPKKNAHPDSLSDFEREMNEALEDEFPEDEDDEDSDEEESAEQ